jgi:hypothetical protein
MVIVAKLVQLKNALMPMVVTLLGMTMFVSAVQPLNIEESMIVKFGLLGNVTLVKPVQSRNASLPILVTLSGKTMLVKPVQSRNALL